MDISDIESHHLFGLKKRHVFFFGILIGIADVIPGISGGTIAFILGIYFPFLTSIKSLNRKTLALLFQGRFYTFCEEIHLQFLTLLAGGMVFSIFLFSKVIYFLLQREMLSLYFFSFLIGVLFASGLAIEKKIKKRNYFELCFFLLGCVTSIFLATGSHKNGVIDLSNLLSYYKPLVFFVGGIAATGAMLIPGISGSFVLLLLGLYEPLIRAIATLTSQSIQIIVSFSLGMVVGFMLFSRIFTWFYQRHPDSFYGFVMGMIISGSVLLGFQIVMKIMHTFSSFLILTSMIVVMITGFLLFFKFQILEKNK